MIENMQSENKEEARAFSRKLTALTGAWPEKAALEMPS
jgi:hypothetical protein